VFYQMFKSDSCEVQLTGVDMYNFRLFAVYTNCVTCLLEWAENYRHHVCAVYCLLVKTCQYRRIFVLFHNDLNRFFVVLVIYLILVLTSELWSAIFIFMLLLYCTCIFNSLLFGWEGKLYGYIMWFLLQNVSVWSYDAAEKNNSLQYFYPSQ